MTVSTGLVPLLPSTGLVAQPPPNPSLFARTDASGRAVIDPRAASEAIDAARPAYVEALAYYDGTIESLVVASHPKLQPYLRLYRYRVLAPVVDLVSEALTIGRTEFADEAAEEVYRARVWEACQMGLRVVPEAIHLACLHGDSIIFTQRLADGTLRKGVLDPRTARMLHDPATGDALALVQQQPLPGGGSALEVMTPHYVARYEDRRIGGVALNTWTLVAGGPNPHGRITAVHLSNVARRGYGSPEHQKAYGMAVSAAKLWATFQLMMETAALPMTVILDKAKEAGVGLLPGAQPRGGADSAPVTIDPGSIVRMIGDSLEQIGGVNPAGFLAGLDRVTREICKLTSSPEDELTDSPISGVARREKRKRFTTKVLARQRSFGVALADDAELSMALLGLDGGRASIHWEAADPLDVTDVWDVADKQRHAGVPLRDVLESAGWEPDAVAQATAGSAIETGVALVAALTPEAVEAFAAAVGAFAEAVERGQADPSQLAALLTASAAAAKSAAAVQPTPQGEPTVVVPVTADAGA